MKGLILLQVGTKCPSVLGQQLCKTHLDTLPKSWFATKVDSVDAIERKLKVFLSMWIYTIKYYTSRNMYFPSIFGNIFKNLTFLLPFFKYLTTDWLSLF